MEGGSSGTGSRRMRSHDGQEWRVNESLILVNEIAAVEADCLKELSTHQKWRIISENCTAQLDVPRTANQCRRRWSSLVAQYTAIVSKSRKIERLDEDLFSAVDGVVRARAERSDSDSDSDHEAGSDSCEIVETLGSKRQRRSEEKPPSKGKHKKNSREEEMHFETYVEEWPAPEEQRETTCLLEEDELVAQLCRSAEQVHTIASENADYATVKAMNFQAFKSSFADSQGMRLIASLELMVGNLNRLSDYAL